MSGQWPAAGWGQRNEEFPDAASPGTDAAAPETAPVEDVSTVTEEAVGADPQTASAETDSADAVEAVAEATETETSDPAIAAASDDVAVEAVADAPAQAAEAPAAEAPAAIADASGDQGGSGSSFLDELVRAMRATAAVERARLAGDTDRRRETHIQSIQARAASEVERMRELAAEDMRSIQAWAEGEMKRIQVERQRRETELNQDLETSLAEHRSMIDREIERIEGAISAYRTEMEAFFEGLDHETDPILIASQATKHPVFPALAVEGDEHVGTASAGAALVGVMGPPSQAGDALAAAVPAVAPEPARAVDADAPAEPIAGEGAAEAEPVGAAAGSARASSSVLDSIPVVRPLGWLRRDANGSDHSSHEG
jgi:hypothetical protein